MSWQSPFRREVICTTGDTEPVTTRLDMSFDEADQIEKVKIMVVVNRYDMSIVLRSNPGIRSRDAARFNRSQLDGLRRELEDLRLENLVFRSYFERHASNMGADPNSDKKQTSRPRRRQLPAMLTIEQKVEIGVHEQEVAHRDVSNTFHEQPVGVGIHFFA